MRRALFALCVASSAALGSVTASATVRSFGYTHESDVLGAGQTELQPWTTFRAGQSRYYSALDARLGLEHGFARGLELGLYFAFRSETRDVVASSLTQELVRLHESELLGSAATLKYSFSDRRADVLGSAVYADALLGPRQSQLRARLIVDRSIGNWLVAGNLLGALGLESRRGAEGSELETRVVLEPSVAGAYRLPHGVSLGLELRAPLGLSDDAKSRTLFGGPVLRFADQRMWATLGVQPQLAAFSNQSAGSRLDLNEAQRLEVRLLAGFLL